MEHQPIVGMAQKPPPFQSVHEAGFAVDLASFPLLIQPVAPGKEVFHQNGGSNISTVPESHKKDNKQIRKSSLNGTTKENIQLSTCFFESAFVLFTRGVSLITTARDRSLDELIPRKD